MSSAMSRSSWAAEPAAMVVAPSAMTSSSMGHEGADGTRREPVGDGVAHEQRRVGGDQPLPEVEREDHPRVRHGPAAQQRRRVDPVGGLGGGGGRDHRAQRVPGDVEAVDAEVVDDRHALGDELLDGQRGGGQRRLARAGELRPDEPQAVVLGQGGDGDVPGQAVLGRAVVQQHGRAALDPCGVVPNGGPVHVDRRHRCRTVGVSWRGARERRGRTPARGRGAVRGPGDRADRCPAGHRGTGRRRSS